MKVKDAMHKGVEWVSPDTPVVELAKLMCGYDIGAIPVGVALVNKRRKVASFLTFCTTLSEVESVYWEATMPDKTPEE